MTVSVLSEERERLRLTAPGDEPRSTPQHPTKPTRVEVRYPTGETIAVLQALSHVVQIRIALFLAGGGAFVLAMYAAVHPSWGTGAVAASFDILVVAPIAAINLLRKG